MMYAKKRLKNKFKFRQVISFILVMVLTIVGSGAYTSTVHAADFSGTGCVDWVKYRALQIGITLPKTGLNEYGLYGASAYWTNLTGYSKGSTPAANSLAVWKYNNGTDGYGGKCGHVAFVESVSGNNVTVTEGGCNGYSYNGHTGVICRTRTSDQIKTLGNCSGFLGYIYLKSAPVSNITFSEQKTVSVSTTNAVMYTKINNPGKQQFSKVGCYLYNESGTQIKSYSEQCSLSTSYVNYNCDFNADMKYTLTPGTTYKYVLYAVVGGKEYKDSMRSFKTTGSAPSVAAPITFKNQKTNFTTETNAEVYVYIDNPSKANIPTVGCYLYDNAGKLVKSYSEICNLSTSYVNYTCNFNSDAKYTLSPGTVYKYVLYAVVGGKEYKDTQRTFTTTKAAYTVAPPATATPAAAPIAATEKPAVRTDTPASGGGKSISDVIAWAIDIAYDDSHGYSQSYDRRWGNPDYDCSSFVISAFEKAGFDVSEAVNTKNIRSVFEKAGFRWIPRGQIDLSNASDLKVGDVLLKEGSHTEIYIGHNQMVGAHGGTYSIYDDGYPGDDCGEEISVVSYSDKSWDGVLRYGSDIQTTSDVVTKAPAVTVSPVKTASPTKAPADVWGGAGDESDGNKNTDDDGDDYIIPYDELNADDDIEEPAATTSPGWGNTDIWGNDDTDDHDNGIVSISKPAKVAISSVKSPKKKTLKIKWLTAKNSNGYEVQISTKKSFGSKIIRYTLKKSITIKQLKRKKKYYVRIRAYNYHKNGAWSKVKKIKIK